MLFVCPTFFEKRTSFFRFLLDGVSPSNKTNLETSAWLVFQATFQFNGGTSNGQRDMIPSGQAAYTLPKVPSQQNRASFATDTDP